MDCEDEKAHTTPFIKLVPAKKYRQLFSEMKLMQNTNAHIKALLSMNFPVALKISGID